MIKICPLCGTDHCEAGLYCSPECRIKAWQKNYYKNSFPKVNIRPITKCYESKQHEIMAL